MATAWMRPSAALSVATGDTGPRLAKRVSPGARGVGVLLMLTGLFLGGCLWKRLQVTGGSLARWDSLVEVTATSDLYKLRFLEPVLLERDLRELGWIPSTRTANANQATWETRFQGDGLPEACWRFEFIRGKLATIELPRPLTHPILPPPLLRRYGMLLGTADVSLAGKSAKSIASRLPESDPLTYPALEVFRQTFGLPDAATWRQDGELWTRFAYTVQTDAGEGPRFRFTLRHTEDGSFVAAILRWDEGVLVFGVDSIEAFLPSSWKKAGGRDGWTHPPPVADSRSEILPVPPPADPRDAAGTRGT